MKYKELGGGLIKRRESRIVGLFIDGTGLDRATRRMKKKVDLSSLVKGVTSGMKPSVARYYTLIPYEDDSRQRAFLEAVSKAGLSVIVKRLPPKGVTRQVSVDVELGSDIAAFALGHYKFSSLSEFVPSDHGFLGSALPTAEPFFRPGLSRRIDSHSTPKIIEPTIEKPTNGNGSPLDGSEKRVIVVVCPSRDLSYSIALASELGADTATADFGHFNNTGDVLKSASKWIDLSDSETIWRD